MYTINLKELMINRTYPEAGAALYAEFCLYKDTVDKIIVNLDGVEILPSMFLNTSIGAYIDNFGKESLKEKISFAKITRSQAERLRDYLARY
ncbi:MAG: STAS-like domain-containing protein [Paludibacteraceae bacterium]|nr:STAS-like domain-containing protein [Paludibacteraceae bacterium]